jgi:TonB family protein
MRGAGCTARRAVAGAVLLAASLFTPPGVAAQGAAPTDPAAEAVARPISPGAVALLLPHSAAPAMPRRLFEALGDPRPEVRAVAARVAFTTRHAALTQALGDALDRETNPAAAAEIVRALALIQGAAADDRISRRLPEFDSRATAAWLAVMSRVRPSDVWPRLADVRSAGGDIGPALLRLVQADPTAAAAAFAPLPGAPHLLPAYQAVLSALRPTHPLPPWPVLAPGVATDATRGAVLQLLVRRAAAGQPLPPEAVEAVRAVDDSPEFAWLVLYRELVRRAQTPAPARVSQRDTILRIDLATLPATFLADPLLAWLDGDEATSFRQLVGTSWAPFAAPASPTPSRAPRPAEPIEDADGSVTRLARPLTAALTKDLQSLLAGRPIDGNVAVLAVRYRPTGQVRNVTTVTGIDPDGCTQAAALIAALDVAPGTEPISDGRVDRVVIGMRPSDLSCDRFGAVVEPTPERVGSRTRAPKKTRNVSPVYPAHLIKERIQGMVIAESLITTTGCVVDAVVIRRVNAELDVSALAAMSEWRYEPAVVNGSTVPVIMIVTVSFSLQ